MGNFLFRVAYFYFRSKQCLQPLQRKINETALSLFCELGISLQDQFCQDILVFAKSSYPETLAKYPVYHGDYFYFVFTALRGEYNVIVRGDSPEGTNQTARITKSTECVHTKHLYGTFLLVIQTALQY